jgi:alkanesulfonate monooxygenase SsuD/methylene tetrahydromethanopterin reductase-like flavin-dependent oxidoreductase (luciferase family)
MLEEGLEVLTGLWSGNPFSYQGSHYRAETPGFAPPAQTPRIPIWVAGTWPFKKPFRRAAHWDGVIPISSNWPAELTPGEIRDVAAYCKLHRTNDDCFDVACYGWTEGNDPRADAAIVASFEEAGATWWIEHRFSWEMPLDQLLERVRKGPPRA